MAIRTQRDVLIDELFKKLAEIDAIATRGLSGLHFDGMEYRGLQHRTHELREEVRAIQRTSPDEVAL